MEIREAADIPHALGAGMESGGLLIDESQLGPDFFDLRTGLAGEVLQKFTNYRVRLAHRDRGCAGLWWPVQRTGARASHSQRRAFLRNRTTRAPMADVQPRREMLSGVIAAYSRATTRPAGSIHATGSPRSRIRQR